MRGIVLVLRDLAQLDWDFVVHVFFQPIINKKTKNYNCMSYNLQAHKYYLWVSKDPKQGNALQTFSQLKSQILSFGH